MKNLYTFEVHCADGSARSHSVALDEDCTVSEVYKEFLVFLSAEFQWDVEEWVKKLYVSED